MERSVEGGCVRKHIIHILHFGHVPFVERLVDDIGGQEPQSSEEFLLCQLRQPFSGGEATAQLFGVARTRSGRQKRDSQFL